MCINAQVVFTYDLLISMWSPQAIRRMNYWTPTGDPSSMEMSCTALIARFRGATWGPPGADKTQVGPMLAPWILLSWELHWGPLRITDHMCWVVACQITDNFTVFMRVFFSIIFWYVLQRKHQSYVLLALCRGFHRWPVDSPHKISVMRK